MTTPRLWPTFQVLGRTIVCNRSDILQQGVRAYNYQNVHLGPPSFNNHFNNNSFHQTHFEDKLQFKQNLLHKGKGSYLKVVSRSFSNGVHLFCREFTDGENEHAHDVLCSLPAYKTTTVNTKSGNPDWISALSMFAYRNKYWPSVGTDELVYTFECISKISSVHSITLEDEQYHLFFLSLIERIPYINDNQLLKVLLALSQWTPTQSNNNSKFDLLWKALDEYCSRRLIKWDISKIFLVADHWYALRISKVSVFYTKLLNTLGMNILNMTPTQLVQFMFYVNLNRDFGIVKKVHLEKKIEEALKSVSIEEIGIIAMALFKTQTIIENGTLIDGIVKTTTNNFESISNHSLGSILKLLNKSLPGNAQSQCYDFLDTLNPHLNKFNNFVLLQAALFGNNLLVFHKEVMSKIGARFGQQMKDLRLKDIERFTYTLMVYKFTPPECPDILNLIIEELRKPDRVVEINHFPKCFVSCVNYLVAMGAFPHDLISAALQPSMIQLLNSNSFGDIGREVNELNWTLKIEIPSGYLGYALNQHQSQNLTKRFMGRLPTANVKRLTHQERLLVDIQLKMSAMMGVSGCVEPTFILPHFSNPDLIFCTTREGKPVQLPKEYKRLHLDVLKPVKDLEHLGLLWNAVMIGGRNSFIRESKELKGNLEMKKRQLRILGYNVSVVSYLDYVKTSMKYKLLCLERSLQESSLNLEGRKEIAMSVLKGDPKPQAEERLEAVAN